MKVWQAQCLCPNGHDLAVVTDEFPDGVPPDAMVYSLQEKLQRLIAEGICDPWCMKCHALASQWRYEAKLLPYDSLAEVTPLLHAKQYQDTYERQFYAEHRFISQTRH